MNVIELYNELEKLLKSDPSIAHKQVDLTDGWGRACRWDGNLSATVDSVRVGTKVYRTRTMSTADKFGSLLLSAQEVVILSAMLEGRGNDRANAKVFELADKRFCAPERANTMKVRFRTRLRIALRTGRYLEAYGRVYR